jgi:MFS family permease
VAQILPDFSPLRQSREFRLLYTGQFVGAFGNAVSFVVLPIQMYALTQSPFSVGLLGLVEFFPMFFMAFVGGALADRVDRRRLIVASELGLATVCALLAVNALSPAPQVWPLWIGAALLAALGAIHRPAMEALTPQLVPRDKITAVATLNSLRGNFAHIAGPGIAGLVATYQGPGVAFLLNLGTYLFSAAMIALLRPLPRLASHGEALTWDSFLAGWRYARGRQELMGTYLIDINAMFFGMPTALFPAIGAQWGAASVGLLYAAPFAGGFLMSLSSGWTSKVHRHGLAITIAASLWGVAIVGFGLSSNLYLALFFLALAGAADRVSAIFRMTIWNQTIPAELRGRTAAIEMVSYLSGPYLGNAEAGLAARLFGLRASVVSGGVLCVAGCVALGALLPRFLAYDSRKQVQTIGK